MVSPRFRVLLRLVLRFSAFDRDINIYIYIYLIHLHANLTFHFLFEVYDCFSYFACYLLLQSCWDLSCDHGLHVSDDVM